MNLMKLGASLLLLVGLVGCDYPVNIQGQVFSNFTYQKNKLVDGVNGQLCVKLHYIEDGRFADKNICADKQLVTNGELVTMVRISDELDSVKARITDYDIIFDVGGSELIANYPDGKPKVIDIDGLINISSLDVGFDFGNISDEVMRVVEATSGMYYREFNDTLKQEYAHMIYDLSVEEVAFLSDYSQNYKTSNMMIEKYVQLKNSQLTSTDLQKLASAAQNYKLEKKLIDMAANK